MDVQELFELVINKAKSFGLQPKNEGGTIIDLKGNAIIRKNILDLSFSEGTAYFGIISPEEETSGAYSDYSFVVFPDQDLKACVVSLGIGSLGFKNDYELAALPGVRRSFLQLQSYNDKAPSFFKTSFLDIESTFSILLKEVKEKCPQLSKVIDSYKTVLPAAAIVDFETLGEDNALDIIYAWLGTYANLREWGTIAQRNEINEVLEHIPSVTPIDEQTAIEHLVENRKYVVLQGAPGTGKTWTALKIADKYDKTFFEQFHAETTYSDFVYGIEPNTNNVGTQLQFRDKKGILCEALEYAVDHQNEKVLLIIDEINRANLSNVLGPVFYLFEYQTGKRKVTIKIGGRDYTCIPDNLYVIATMNTADRSLAVVDFALRRRFAWYTLRPHVIAGRDFDKQMFNAFANIFFRYATDEELNLQPGQAYFTDKQNRQDRMVYELMPLIKEYLAEGYLLKAKDAFYDLFLKETGKLMYE